MDADELCYGYAFLFTWRSSAGRSRSGMCSSLCSSFNPDPKVERWGSDIHPNAFQHINRLSRRIAVSDTIRINALRCSDRWIWIFTSEESKSGITLLSTEHKLEMKSESRAKALWTEDLDLFALERHHIDRRHIRSKIYPELLIIRVRVNACALDMIQMDLIWMLTDRTTIQLHVNTAWVCSCLFAAVQPFFVFFCVVELCQREEEYKSMVLVDEEDITSYYLTYQQLQKYQKELQVGHVQHEMFERIWFL